ncbi:hypothetical protein BHD05_09610 [Marisediminicola antarctica]|uniref:Uncharacterized protein n=1 Tax=Marisediminicola antarctica TaxID=674079 RepID=A0A7L5AH23_9MICO|nr:hypothetical protein BHD05_09610 [Marisediminicola antarctica]
MADLVIRGEVIKIKHGIKLGEDKTVDYKAYTVTPTGSGKQSAVNVIVSEAYNGIPVAFEGRPELEVGDEAIWTLTKIDPQFNYKGYVLVGSTSLFPLDGDQIVGDGDAPGQVEAAKLGGKGTLQKLTGKTS